VVLHGTDSRLTEGETTPTDNLAELVRNMHIDNAYKFRELEDKIGSLVSLFIALQYPHT
jgi:hypothetical protein